jgi:hypothetical protein
MIELLGVFFRACAPAAWAIAVALKSASVAAAIINLLVILLLRTSYHWGLGSALCSELDGRINGTGGL